jgi:hypothetical protein
MTNKSPAEILASLDPLERARFLSELTDKEKLNSHTLGSSGLDPTNWPQKVSGTLGWYWPDEASVRREWVRNGLEILLIPIRVVVLL